MFKRFIAVNPEISGGIAVERFFDWVKMETYFQKAKKI